MIYTTEKLKIIRDILLEVTDKVYHYTKLGDEKDKYIVWAEDGEGQSIYSDDIKEDQVIQGTIDYYTKDDFDPLVDEIQDGLSKEKIPYYLGSVQYEDETNLIHYEWVWEVS